MGQVQSDDYDCEDGATIEDVADSEINSRSSTSKRNDENNLTRGNSNQRVRKLSNVSHRNIQLLSMKPRGEKDAYADDLRNRRRSSLINLILGAPSSGPRFSDDLCSLSSHMSELCNFGIEFFPDTATAAAYHHRYIHGSSSLRIDEISEINAAEPKNIQQHSSGSVHGGRRADYVVGGKGRVGGVSGGLETWERNLRCHRDEQEGTRRRRSSLGNEVYGGGTPSGAPQACESPSGDDRGAPSESASKNKALNQFEANSKQAAQDSGPQRKFSAASAAVREQFRARYQPSLSSTLASIDLTSSFEKHDKSNPAANQWHAVSSATDWTARHQQPHERRRTILERGPTHESPKTGGELSARLQSRLGGSRSQFQHQRVLRRSGSELSLYSTLSSNSSGSHGNGILQQELAGGRGAGPMQRRTKSGSGISLEGTKAGGGTVEKQAADAGVNRETKSIIMLQVCLPFILAGFGNMAAGLVLSKVAQWKAFRDVPLFFVLLPSFVGLKSNIEMTLASRLSTLSNLNLLETSHQRRHAYVSNLILILSQAIGLSVLAAIISILCELLLGNLDHQHYQQHHHSLNQNHNQTMPIGQIALDGGGSSGRILQLALLVVLPTALITSAVLVIIASLVVSVAIAVADVIQVNPDNLSTLIAASYGDVTCVLTYGLFAELMYSLHQSDRFGLPIAIIVGATVSWPALCYAAYKFKETHNIALASMPPMITGIFVSMGSGAVLSLVVSRFKLIALYQPIVNGFGANLIAVQASRVSTWLWCHELRRISISTMEALNKEELAAAALPKGKSSLAAFDRLSPATGEKLGEMVRRVTKRATKVMFWSFCNSSPNSVAARLLLLMLIPAHSIYFCVIWLVSPNGYVTLTWQFYSIYIMLCLVQVFILLSICEPLMTLLMRRHLDPDIFGISLLMALADLTGTLCLASAFLFLATIGDANAI